MRYGRTSALGSAVVPSLLDAASHDPAGRPMGAPPSHHALVWLPFSGTTVMGLPAEGPDTGLTRAPSTINPLEPSRLKIEKRT